MKISIVIPVFRQVDTRFTELCIESIRENSKEHHEIIVVVNPGTNTDAYNHLDADIIGGIEEQGQGHANNLGIGNATNEWIMIADNDNVFPPNWEKGLELLKPDIVLTFNSMEPIQGAPGFIFNNCGDIKNFNKEKFYTDAVEMAEEKFMPGTTYPFIVEKKHLETIEGFDTEFDPWGCTIDTDIRYKMMLLGLDLKRYFGIICYHFSQQTAWKDGNIQEKEAGRNANRRYFETKWNLAQAPSPQIWYSEFMINEDRRRFQPEWAGQVSKRWLGTEADNEYWQCDECRYVNFNKRDKCLNCNHDKI